jgi:hypothetical protein
MLMIKGHRDFVSESQAQHTCSPLFAVIYCRTVTVGASLGSHKSFPEVRMIKNQR